MSKYFQRMNSYEDPNIYFGEYEYYPSPVWSSNSQSIFVAIPSKGTQEITATLTTWQISVESGIASQLGVFFANDPFPSLAADQNLVAFLRAKKLHIGHFDGSDEFPISSQGGRIFWSPGARFFSLASEPYSTSPRFLVYDLCGWQPLKLLGAQTFYGWLDDSSFIFTGYAPGTRTSGLFLGSIDGSITEIAAGVTVDAIDVLVMED